MSLQNAVGELWFISVDGMESTGPFTQADIVAQIQSRKISAETTQIWKEGLDGWVVVSQIEGFLPPPIPELVPPPPPPLPESDPLDRLTTVTVAAPPPAPSETNLKAPRASTVTAIKRISQTLVTAPPASNKTQYQPIKVAALTQFALLPGRPSPVDVLTGNTQGSTSGSKKLFGMLAFLALLGVGVYVAYQRGILAPFLR